MDSLASSLSSLSIQDSVPNDVYHLIFGLLSPKDLARSARVCKKWNHLVHSDVVKNYHRHLLTIYGENTWKGILGDPGREPSLPKKIFRICGRTNPYIPTETIGQTARLFFIPTSITRVENEKLVHYPMTLNNFKKLILYPCDGHIPTQFAGSFEKIVQQHGDVAITTPYWVLITKRFVAERRWEVYGDQSPAGDFSPVRLIEAVIGSYLEFMVTKKNTGIYEGKSFIRCEEQIAVGEIESIDTGELPLRKISGPIGGEAGVRAIRFPSPTSPS